MKTLVNNGSQTAHVSAESTPAPLDDALMHAPEARSTAMADPPLKHEAPATLTNDSAPITQGELLVSAPAVHRYRKWLLAAGIVAALAVGGYFSVPWVNTVLNTVSTDDAYINGHVTFVAPRVSGQVKKVLVDDNDRVKKGDLLLQLDKEPFQVQVALKRAAVKVAEANLAAAESKARSLEAQLGSQRWKLQSACEQVDSQVALLAAQDANLRTQEATLDVARADYDRGQRLLPSSAISREDFDHRHQQYRVATANVKQAREAIHQTRAALGLSPEPEKGKSLTDVPPDLNQTFSAVRTALADCMDTMTQLGLPLGFTGLTPNKALEEFRRFDKEGDIDRILRNLLPKVPSVLQANAALEQARHDLEQAELNLRYCDIVSEIDGVVTSRNVNPGNDVQFGQSLMAVRSVNEIWIDANFKETQLADLRIGQRVRCEVDMYGGRREFEGRIAGFTMGTGQTLALLPPQNATGNFVKIIQRLPVRIELTDYDANKSPLFVGLSVTPYVYYREAPTGSNAGEVLQPHAAMPKGNSEPKS
jgi:membrane fusion protein (multidrug efflux system)